MTTNPHTPTPNPQAPSPSTPPSTAPVAGQSVEALAREQVGLYAALTGLSRAQHTAIDGRDAEGLDRVLAEREGLIQRLTEVAGALASREREVEAAKRTGAGLVKDLAEAARLAGVLAASDRQDLSDLEGQREALAREIEEVGRAGRAAGAYGKPAAKGALFQDTEA